MRLFVILTLTLALLRSTASALTLEFWHAWPEQAQTIRYLASRYGQRTGVSIHVRVMSPSAHITWGATGGPDLAGLNRPNKLDIQAMARRGLVYDLRGQMSRGWYALFWPSLLDVFSLQDGGIYGVPLTSQVHVFVYNKQLFRKAHIGVPRTWNELMAASRRLRATGVMPYAGGFGSDRPPLAAAYEYGYLGLHLLTETYAGHYPYTAPQWLAYLRLYVEMRSNGFTNATYATLSESAAAKDLINGKVAMVFMDPSFESIRRSYKPAFVSWGVFAVPQDSRARFLARMPGGVVDGLVINSHSVHITQAIAFARWLTQYTQQLALARGSLSIPAMTVASNSEQLLAPLRAFASVGMRDMEMDIRIYEKPRVLAAFYSGVREILAGTSNPSATARRTAKVKR